MPELKAAIQGKLDQLDDSVADFSRKSAQVQDEEMKQTVAEQRDRVAKELASIEGDVGLLVDISGSMERAIQYAAYIGARVAAHAQDRVMLSFFSTTGRVVEVTGWTLSEIESQTSRLRAHGGTTTSVGLPLMEPE